MILVLVYISGVFVALVLGKVFNMYVHKSFMPLLPLSYIVASWMAVGALVVVKLIDIVIWIFGVHKLNKLSDWFYNK